MVTVHIKELKVITNNEFELWCLCPAHDDNNRPNLWVTKDNGLGYCFACGFKCRVKGLNMKIERVKKPKTKVNWNKYIPALVDGDLVKYINRLAKEWNVDYNILHDYNIGWNGNTYTIPVYNELGNIIGLQRRYPDGQKIMVKGSKLGVFKPSNLNIKDTLFICEGASDSIIATHLGFPTIGRLSATSSSDIIVKFIKLYPKIKKICIISDADDVGQNGAENLKTKLDKIVSCDIINVLVGKDLREHYEHCGFAETKKFLKDRVEINKAVNKVVKEYGDTLRKLGNEC